MRRPLLVLMVFPLIGLASVFASTFTANTEDLGVYSAPVSSIVPPCEPTPVPFPLYLHGALITPANNNNSFDNMVLQTTQSPSGQDFTAQLDDSNQGLVNETTPSEFLLWRGTTVSPSPPSCGWDIAGRVRLRMWFNGPVLTSITAGLFSCAPSAPAHSKPPCVLLASGTQVQGTLNFFWDERIIDMGVQNLIVPAGQQLRVKLIENWTLGQVTFGWGNLRPSRVELVAP